MKNKIKYQILNQTFSSQEKAEESARAILYNDVLNTTLNEADHEYMCAYFRLFHLEWEEKIGVGIKNIFRIKEPQYGKVRGFKIVRLDESDTDISFIIERINKNDFKQQFNSALRFIVEPQIFEFKEKSFGSRLFLLCPIENVEVTKDNCHIDHDSPTFKEIVNSFVLKYNIKIDKDILVKSTDNQLIPELANAEMIKQFFDYHKELANLRVVSIKANLSILKNKN